jgi:acid phosphatase family membrane protein YuiD
VQAAISGHSGRVGLDRGLHKVAEVIFGCVVGLMVSWLMSKVWLVRPPPEQPGTA